MLLLTCTYLSGKEDSADNYLLHNHLSRLKPSGLFADFLHMQLPTYMQGIVMLAKSAMPAYCSFASWPSMTHFKSTT